ncbi:MAG TPA: chorismate mutase [Pyrinomonadaceae bacterium]|nr:chorismate mutase [Pyrinomonadaceae bacterium]
MNLQESRKKIDLIDEQIVTLLNRRAAEVKQVSRIKAAAGIPLVDSQRESEIYRRITAENFGQIDNDGLLRIFEQIVAESRRLQANESLESRL